MMPFQQNLLPAFKSLHGKNKGEAWSGIMFVWWTTTTLTASKKTGYTELREKTVKLGWNGGGEQCRRAAVRFYGLGSCSQPPPPGPSSFLRCTVVYTWATMNHICWKKRGRTMKQWGDTERGDSVKHRVTLDMWFVTPSRCSSILITLTFCSNSNLHALLWGIHIISILFWFWCRTCKMQKKNSKSVLKHSKIFITDKLSLWCIFIL